MRKFAIGTCAALALLSPAHAGFYTGLDGQYSFADWKNSASTEHAGSTTGFALRFGYRTDYLGAELGYETGEGDFGGTSSSSTWTSGHFTLRNFALDGFAYLPLAETGWFQPFVTAGVAYAQANERTIKHWSTTTTSAGTVNYFSVTPSFATGEVDWRAGAGLAWRLNETITGRVIVRYQPYNFDDRLTNGSSINFGFTFTL